MYTIPLPYEDDFDESKVPTKARPNLVNLCGVALRFMYKIHQNRKRLYDSVFYFSKFDTKSASYQIKIEEKDKYETAFTVPFECNAGIKKIPHLNFKIS
ncbi:hypothetical protein CR513_36181, partial [Mucuna pruriens]